MIHITKSGFKCFEWDSTLRRNVEETNMRWAAHLRDCVVLVEEGVTLEDVITFTAAEGYIRLFVGMYTGCDILGLYGELKNGVKPLDLEDKIKYCTVSWAAEIWPGSSVEPTKELQVVYDFHGCGEGNQQWALDLTPLAEIAALPFRLEANASVQRLDEEPYETIRGLAYTPSLLELLDAIFWDISFHGDEAEKMARREMIVKQVREIKD